MLFKFLKPTIPALIGLFFGIALMLWIAPDEPSGQAIIVVLGCLFGVLCGAIFAKMTNRKVEIENAED